MLVYSNTAQYVIRRGEAEESSWFSTWGMRGASLGIANLLNGMFSQESHSRNKNSGMGVSANERHLIFISLVESKKYLYAKHRLFINPCGPFSACSTLLTAIK